MARVSSPPQAIKPEPLLQQLLRRIEELEARAGGTDAMLASQSDGVHNLGTRLHAVEVQFPEGIL